MKIVYSYYVMDLLHTGHILMLKNSKAIAGLEGRLVVGIVSDEAVLSWATMRREENQDSIIGKLFNQKHTQDFLEWVEQDSSSSSGSDDGSDSDSDSDSSSD